ncbi:probable G-protein coupled receptor Mth-like 6 isoform X2 [Leptinotarsa decemlineata]|uniref:probable G-protein coupled receptor Mth-like 6 isoform X2 n=1 Tax=Leptinotarsa decemlineata TaxID=7539 RepID=UPI003D30420E
MRLLIFASVAVLARAQSFWKCCDFGEALGSSYECKEDLTKRLGVVSNLTNFLSRGIDGKCSEATDKGIITLQLLRGEIVAEALTIGKFFPKCCPLGHFYNPQIHSCAAKGNFQHDFAQGKFVKVGLPQCKFIVDNPDPLEPGADYCLDEDSQGKLVRRECREDTKICKEQRCVKKCCTDGKSFVGGSICLDTYTHGISLNFSSNIEDPTAPFALISNRTCSRIFLMSEERYIFNLLKNGVFRFYQNITESFVEEGLDAPNSYCIEHSNSPKGMGFFFFKCFPDLKIEEKFVYTKWSKILSCVFLVLTILIYLLLGETRNLFGKILINYCVGTLLLFLLLIYVHTDLEPNDSFCILLGYSLIFFSTALFAWLNVMCCDIWLTFGTTKHSIGITQRRKDLKRLLVYMSYGWGVPLILTLIIYMFTSLNVLPYEIQPFVGTTQCFIESRTNNYAGVLFLRLPHLIIQIINTVLFVQTISYCLRIKNEINKIDDTIRHQQKYKFKRDQERLFLILKLSVIMGVNYSFDALSAFVKMSDFGTVAKYIEVTWDCINCLQGVFIFLIFICKRKIYNDFLRKLNIRRTDHLLQNTQTHSMSSATTRFSLKNGRNSLK